MIIGVLFFAVTSALAVTTALYMDQGPNDMLGSILYTVIPLFISLLAIMLSYDTISGERSRGSLVLVLSKPVERWVIFSGKFLAVVIVVGLMVLLINSWGYWLNGMVYGEFPSGQEVLLAYQFFLSSLLPVLCWSAFAMFFSTLFRSPTTTLVMVLILWILVLPLISEIPAGVYLFTTSTWVSPEPAIYPAWVKITYALNPDNAFLALQEHLFTSSPEFASLRVLTAGEGILAMLIFFSLFLGLGVSFFRRLSLE